MIPTRKQLGFTLIAAIFLLVVVALLVVYMANIRVVQQSTLVFGVQGARAMQAARSGIEWGIFQALGGPGCPATTSFVIPDAALSDFNVTVSCTSTTHIEGGAPAINAYRITAVAEAGSYGSLDYIQRRIQASVSLPPP